MYIKIKTTFDFIFACLLALLILPIFLITSILIYISMGRPIIFVQKRIGYENKIFYIYKFRTMNDKKDTNGELLPDNKRLTITGKYIRKLSLDELPQLYNILRGEMSFIGPRPLLPEYLPLYNEEQLRRHEIKPGITGWAQVNGRNCISWQKKFDFDVYYVDNVSFRVDCKIIFLTFWKVLKADSINQNNSQTMEKFTGNE